MTAATKPVVSGHEGLRRAIAWLAEQGASSPRLIEEACQRYKLTTEEFLSWQASIDEYGLAGLRTTRIQQYRH